MAEFDLTSKMGQYLDRHLVFPLLEFLHEHTEVSAGEEGGAVCWPGRRVSARSWDNTGTRQARWRDRTHGHAPARGRGRRVHLSLLLSRPRRGALGACTGPKTRARASPSPLHLLPSPPHTQLFLEEDLLKSKYELLQQTSMIDSSIDIFKVLNPDQEPAAELVARRDTVVANLCQLQKDSAPLVELFQSKKVQEEAQRGDGQYLRDYLEENHDFKAESLDTLYSYGRILYDIGRYGDAAVVLYQYNALSTDTEKTFSALWGRFAAGKDPACCTK